MRNMGGGRKIMWSTVVDDSDKSNKKWCSSSSSTQTLVSSTLLLIYLLVSSPTSVFPSSETNVSYIRFSPSRQMPVENDGHHCREMSKTTQEESGALLIETG
uniref:Transmembrane protein n=1 Tax=Caenorhabditis tropicalis TaxID=1561998 RepID=A0A1I7TZR7_9PELO